MVEIYIIRTLIQHYNRDVTASAVQVNVLLLHIAHTPTCEDCSCFFVCTRFNEGSVLEVLSFN